MAYRHDDPVARLQRIAHGWPQVGIEGARRHAAQGLVLYRDAAVVEVAVGIVAPAPLAVAAVAARAVAHGRVAHEEEHGVRALAGAAGLGARHQCFGNAVGCVVYYFVYVFDGVGQVVEALRLH